jgi:NADH:ubiquinone oxidoreductase subunit 4 (subunit M)
MGQISLDIINYNLRFVYIKTILLIFLVKTPLFLAHYWLLKAHVEASTLGSIVLAGGLLKMGRYGVYKLINWFTINLRTTVPLVGGVLTSFLCSIQTDFKKIVALISVSHINMSLRALLYSLNSSYKGFMYNNIHHCVSSASLFYMRGIFLSFRGTRLLHNFPFYRYTYFMLIYSLILLNNLGIPPLLNFLNEIYTLRSLIIKNYTNMGLGFLLVIRVSIYTIKLLTCLKKTKLKIFKIHLFINLTYILMFNILIILDLS